MPTQNDSQSFLNRLREIVNANLTNDQFGVNELAREIGMSRSNLHRKLKFYSGKSVSAFICDIKLDRAKSLLMDSSNTISEIAFECGFHSATYFSKCFKSRYGYPPGEERSNANEADNLENPERQKDSKGIVRKKRSVFYFIAALFILLLFTIMFIVWKPFKGVEEPKDKSIAVLPFINDSPDETEMYFINGTMEAILNNLSKIEDLRVVSRTSVEQYRDHYIPAGEIAKEMKVSFILEGSGLKHGELVQLNVQLIDAEDDRHIWTKTFNCHISEIFEVQSEIAESVADELKATITTDERSRIETHPTFSQIAYEFFLKGVEKLDHYGTVPLNSEELQSAEELIRYAIEYDPEFVQPYVQLGWIYWYRYKSLNDAPDSYLDSMRKYAFKAVETDNQVCNALYIRGQYYYMTGERVKAREDFERSLSISPNSREPYTGLGWISYLENDMVGAIENFRKAVMLAPNQSEHLINLGEANRSAGFKQLSDECYRNVLKITGDSAQYFYELGLNECFISEDQEKALSFFERAYSKDSTLIECLKGIGSAYLLIKQYEESFEYMRRFRQELHARNSFDPYGTYVTGYVFLINGQLEKAQQCFDEQLVYSIRLLHESQSAHCSLAIVYALRNEREKAMEHLRALNQMDRTSIYALRNIKSDFYFRTIQNDPEFQQIVRDVEAKYHAEHERVRQWLEENDML